MSNEHRPDPEFVSRLEWQLRSEIRRDERFRTRATQGRWLWSRTIGSTIVGQGLDSAVFITVAFAGTLAGSNLLELVVTQWIVKVAYEVIATPLTYAVVHYVKQREGIDTIDEHLSLNPFASIR